MLCTAPEAFFCSELEASGMLQTLVLLVEAGDFTEECTPDGVELWQFSQSIWGLERTRSRYSHYNLAAVNLVTNPHYSIATCTYWSIALWHLLLYGYS